MGRNPDALTLAGIKPKLSTRKGLPQSDWRMRGLNQLFGSWIETGGPLAPRVFGERNDATSTKSQLRSQPPPSHAPRFDGDHPDRLPALGHAEAAPSRVR